MSSRSVSNVSCADKSSCSGAINLADPTLVLQSRAVTFMDDSTMPAPEMQRFLAEAPATALPFGEYLFNIDDKSGLEISVPDTVFATGAPLASSEASGRSGPEPRLAEHRCTPGGDRATRWCGIETNRRRAASRTVLTRSSVGWIGHPPWA